MSLRQFAQRLGVSAAYLSRLETNDVDPPSEAVLLTMADMLGEQPDVFLAMAGRVSRELQTILLENPEAFGDLIRRLKGAPKEEIQRVARQVRDGDW